MNIKCLSLYDFASKQEYIYRTSKIKEISGASSLLSGMYNKFVEILNNKGIKLIKDFETEFSTKSFDDNNEIDGEVLYDGGGNLMVLWKLEEKYIEANRVISEYLIKNAPGLSLIAAHVPFTGVFDDKKDSAGNIIEEGDRTKLYRKNTGRKNLSPAYDMPAVMPFTQIDPMTFLPVTYKRSFGDKNSVYTASECSLSSDRFAKASNYSKEDSIDENGLLAVIYIDGNSMGKKLQKCKAEDYDVGINNLREFSSQVQKNYVDKPLNLIKDKYEIRKIIGGGDEITILCKAKDDAFEIMKTYFENIKDKEISGECCTSCAGIAVFHAKSPFSVAYDIAEAACEQAKKKAHEKDGNYFSFYYCHGGITNIFDVLHEKEQAHASGKPYSFDDDIDRIEKVKEKLNNAGRANVKSLLEAAQQSKEKYLFEVERINAYLKKDDEKFNGTEEEMRMVYDMAEFYDLWFYKKDEKADSDNNEVRNGEESDA